MVTLTMGLGQTSLLGYVMMSQIKTIAHLGYPTDITMTMVTLAAGHKHMAQAL